MDDIIKVLSGNAEEFEQSAEPRQSNWAPQEPFLLAVMVLIIIANMMGGILVGIHALLVKAGLARKKPKSGFWHWANSPSSSGGSSGSWSSSDFVLVELELERQFFRRWRRFRRRRVVG